MQNRAADGGRKILKPYPSYLLPALSVLAFFDVHCHIRLPGGHPCYMVVVGLRADMYSSNIVHWGTTPESRVSTMPRPGLYVNLGCLSRTSRCTRQSSN